jgi:hypothetical protein
MNHFQPKSLAFYGGAIAFVVALFGVVTAYGEANLKTAQSIGGEYRLNLPVSAPCGSGKSVLLSVQQSGIYVAAALTNPALMRSQTGFKVMTLSGQWQNQRLNLEGQVPMGVLCENSKEGTPPITVKIEGAIAMLPPQSPLPASSTSQNTPKAATLTGTLALNTKAVPFVARRQPASKEAVK